MFIVCRSWVIVNCVKKLLIFALGLDSKTLSDRPAVLNLDRNGHMTIAEAYANPLTNPTEICGVANCLVPA